MVYTKRVGNVYIERNIMGPVTIYEYAELIQNRLTILEKDIQEESSKGHKDDIISPLCQELIKEYYAAFDFFEFMTKNRPDIIDDIKEKLNITN